MTYSGNMCDADLQSHRSLVCWQKILELTPGCLQTWTRYVTRLQVPKGCLLSAQASLGSPDPGTQWESVGRDCIPSHPKDPVTLDGASKLKTKCSVLNYTCVIFQLKLLFADSLWWIISKLITKIYMMTARKKWKLIRKFRARTDANVQGESVRGLPHKNLHTE